LTTSGIAHILNAAVDGGRLTVLNIAENALRWQDYENISEALDSRRSDMCVLKELYASSFENAWESTCLLFEVRGSTNKTYALDMFEGEAGRKKRERGKGRERANDQWQ
jgi:hypothetical protein